MITHVPVVTGRISVNYTGTKQQQNIKTRESRAYFYVSRFIICNIKDTIESVSVVLSFDDR